MKSVKNTIGFETVKILNAGNNWLYAVYLSGQLSYFISICICVSFDLCYKEIFFLFGSMLVICDTAPLKLYKNKKYSLTCVNNHLLRAATCIMQPLFLFPQEPFTINLTCIKQPPALSSQLYSFPSVAV